MSGFSKLFEIDFESSLKFRTRFHRLCPRRGAGGDVAVALIIYEPCSSHNHGTSLNLIININITFTFNIKFNAQGVQKVSFFSVMPF